MKQVASVLVLLSMLACSASIFVLSLTARETAPIIAESVPGAIQEYKRTDTLDELQQFQELERPYRPIWPFVLVTVVVVGVLLLVLGTPFLKQANSLLRQFKRRGGGARPSAAPPAPPIILPPNFGQQALLPPPNGDEVDQW